MRAKFIDHSVKVGLVNSLASGMVQSYTKRAAQQAVTRVENFQPLPPPLVPRGILRFTSRGFALTEREPFPPYLQPEVTFVGGTKKALSRDTAQMT